jgi:ketosteroid isomerase-like protein
VGDEPADFIVSGYEALSRKDIDAWLALASPDVELHEVPEVPDARVYRGRGEAREWAEQMLQLVEEWHWTPAEVLFDEGDTVVVRALVTGHSKAGLPLDMTLFHVIRTDGDKVVSYRGFFDPAAALRAADSSSA